MKEAMKQHVNTVATCNVMGKWNYILRQSLKFCSKRAELMWNGPTQNSMTECLHKTHTH